MAATELTVILSLTLVIGLIVIGWKTNAALKVKSSELDRLKSRFSPIISLDDEIDKLRNTAESIKNQVETVRANYSEKRQILEALEREVAVYSDKIAFAEFGLYEPHFAFEDSEAYKTNIKTILDLQKDMVSSKKAVIVEQDWSVDGSVSKGRTMANRQIRLTLRAFNSECTAAISNTRWNNVHAMEKRIRNAAEQINKANVSMHVIIADKYVNAKIS